MQKRNRVGGGQAGQRLGEEAFLDTGDYAFDEIVELEQRWENRLGCDNFSIAKGYVDHRLKLVVDCLTYRRPGYGQKWRAVFKGFKPISGVDHDMRDFLYFFWREVEIGGRNESEASRSSSCPSGDQKAVSVSDAQSVQLPKLIVPTLVGLQRLNESNGFGGKFLYSFLGGSFKFLDIPCYGERDIVDVDGRVVLKGETASSIVEGSSQILDGIADNEGEVVRDRFQDAELEMDLTSLVVFLDKSFIGIGLPKRFAGGTELLDVGFGPFNL